MALPGEILGEFVDELRARRAAGATPYELLRFLEDHGIRARTDTFKAAFLGWFSWAAFLTHDESGVPIAEETINRKIGRGLAAIAAEGDAWRSAPPFPDVMGRRDREAFRAVSKGHDCYIIVRASHPRARQYRYRGGYRPAPACLLGVVRDQEPSAGLYAADPADSRLTALLRLVRPGWTYDTYVRELRCAGYSVAPEGGGWVIRNATGDAFYPGYFIQGVYDKESGNNLWTRHSGEAIRRELNVRMGAIVVAFGPRDLWQLRDEELGGMLAGLQFPVHVFGPRPGGNVSVFIDFPSLQDSYGSRGFAWRFSSEQAPPGAST